MMDTGQDIGLGRLLDEAVVRRRHRIVAARVREAASAGHLAIVGSSHLPRKCARALKAAGGKVAAFIEYDPVYWGREIEGVPVMGPSEARRALPQDTLTIVGIWSPKHVYAETVAWLAFHGFADVLPINAVFWTIPGELGPHYQLCPPSVYLEHADGVRALHSLLSDETSRSLFAAMIGWRVTLDPSFIPRPDPMRRYFVPDLIRLPDDTVFVDCGAYDGDTLKAFLRWQGDRFKQFLAYEPDLLSVERLKTYVQSLPASLRARIICEPFAVGRSESTIEITSTGMPGSRAESGGAQTIRCVALDESLADTQPTYLKFDIEGAEVDALAGAWQTIERCRPIIGLSVYHTPTDVFALPLAVAERSQDYRFHFRAHDVDGIDFIFYAVPKELSRLS